MFIIRLVEDDIKSVLRGYYVYIYTYIHIYIYIYIAEVQWTGAPRAQLLQENDRTREHPP